MKKILSLITITITTTFAITANAFPTLDELPKIEPGKAALLIYSSSLHETSSYHCYINNKDAGEVEGNKIKLVYLTPGEHHVKIDVPHANAPLGTTISAQTGKYYFVNAYSSTSGKRFVHTTFHLENVNEKDAVAYLQNKEKNKSKWYEFTL